MGWISHDDLERETMKIRNVEIRAHELRKDRRQKLLEKIAVVCIAWCILWSIVAMQNIYFWYIAIAGVLALIAISFVSDVQMDLAAPYKTKEEYMRRHCTNS